MNRERIRLRLARFAMGTRFEVVLLGTDSARLRAAGEAALEEVALLDADLNRFSKGSFLSFLNARAGAAPVRLDPGLFRLFRLCLRVYRKSGGAFDVTVGPLMECWGFHDMRSSGTAGTEGVHSLEAARERVGFRHVALDGRTGTVRFLRPGLSLDFGAVAKGFALDRAAEVLRETGVETALLHGGTSTVLALGEAPEGGPWKVGIRRPGREDRLLGTALLEDRALSLSAPHGRTIQRAGRRLGHVMDPVSGRPAQGAALAAVISASAARADAWSTALLAAGPARFEEVTRAAGGITALLLAEERAGKLPDDLLRRGPRPELFRILRSPEDTPGSAVDGEEP